MTHHCSTLLLHCMDFRFGKALRRWMEEQQLLDDCDIVSVAGAAKNIADPKEATDAEFVLRQIDISVRLHSMRRVILMNHTDCGAYGGRAAFVSEQEERARHESDLAKAAAAIRDRFPELAVERWLAEIEGGNIRFDRIS